MRVGVAGCLGYTGFELVKLLDGHPNITLEVLTARVPDNVKKDPRFSLLLKLSLIHISEPTRPY